MKTTKQDFYSAVKAKRTKKALYDVLWSNYGRVCFEASNEYVEALEAEMKRLRLSMELLDEVIADMRSEFTREELTAMAREYEALEVA